MFMYVRMVWRCIGSIQRQPGDLPKVQRESEQTKKSNKCQCKQQRTTKGHCAEDGLLSVLPFVKEHSIYFVRAIHSEKSLDFEATGIIRNC